MISFRYHVVTIVAILFALAVGLVLGAGPLRGADDTVARAQAGERSRSDLEAQVRAAGLRNRSSEAFARAAAPTLVAGSLRNQSVTLVVLPTAEDRDVTTLTRLLRVAGADRAGTVRVGAKLLDVADKQLVDALGTQLHEGARGVRVPSEAGPYGQLGALLARAIGSTRRGGEPVDRVAQSVLAGLDAAKLVSVDGRLARRGNLVLVVAGPGTGDRSVRRSTGAIVTSLVTSVDAATGGVVLAGPARAAQADGQLRAVRSDARASRRVSTVDSLDSGAGAAVAVLALAGQASGSAGQYGSVGAVDGVLPARR